MSDLSSKAMLVKLSISKWTARKYDKKISEHVAEEYHVTKDSGRYNKQIMAREAIKEITNLSSQSYTFHIENTLPWHDEGTRLLPVTNYETYTSKMREYKDEFERAVTRFLDNYPQYIEQAKVDLNGLFNPNDYPSAYRMYKKFGFNITVDPLPQSSDFRVAISDSESNRIKKEIEDRIQKTNEIVSKDLWSRMYDVISKLVIRLEDKKGHFKDSIIGNIIELVEFLPILNVTDDPNLEKMRRDIEAKFCSIDPQDLRDDKKERKAVAKEARDIMESMAGYIDLDEEN